VTPFRFRAQAALDLRQKEEDAARKRLVEAERASRDASARVDEARARVGQAAESLVSSQSEGAPAWFLGWHRSWMTKQRLEVDARSRDAAVSAAAAERATASVLDAHKRRRTLERLRDRLRHRHAAEAARRERRDMDDLAVLRFLAGEAQGGTEREHNFGDDRLDDQFDLRHGSGPDGRRRD
jgi:flagellar export protein FliJ